MSTKQGRRGEDRAARYLQHRGFTVLGRNIRLGRGELDIVAKRGDLIVFVEVKAHQSRESSLLSMHADKCSRLQSAAETWLSRHLNQSDCQCRFDLIILTPRVGLPAWVPPRIEHMEDIIR
ncbi:MAG: YraN family protein [Mariprofundaceae bacterium]|nr:YraN family protein [Mariprofundaceae bacterium]